MEMENNLLPQGGQDTSVLARLTYARQILAEVRTLPQAKEIMDVAVAAEVYAKQRQLGEEAERYAFEIRLRAERKIGKILIETPKNPGAKGIGPIAVPKGNHNTPTLKEMGLTKKLSMLAQELARLPEEQFEEFATGIRDARELKRLLKKPKSRKENDFYPTPGPLVNHLFERVPEIELTHRILEPCAGRGDLWVEMQRRQRARVDALDIEPGFEECRRWDATERQAWQIRADSAFSAELLDKPDLSRWAQEWTISNPPFDQAEKIVPLAWEYSRVGVAFLLRLTFLEPCNGRAEWLEEHADQLRYVLTCNPRPRFRDDTTGTDQATVAWLVWLKDWSWEKKGIAPPVQFIRKWR